MQEHCCRKLASLFRLFWVPVFICLVSSPSSAMAFQETPPSQNAGSISGHIYIADCRPISGTTITLLNTQTTIHRTAQSDASGFYVFSSLPAGQYWLLAFHPDYFAEYFNMVPRKGYVAVARKESPGAPHMFNQGITLHTDSSAAIADFDLRPFPPVQALRDEALLTSYSMKERAQLLFSSGTFSPDRRYLALQTSNVITGDSEQVWRYELSTGQLVPVTPTPTNATSPAIHTLRWVGDSIHVIGTDHLGARLFQAEIPEQGSPSITYTQHFPWPKVENRLSSAGRYTLTSVVLHGGSATWTAQLDGRGPSKVIAVAILNAPVVDAAIPFFFYVPVTYPATFLDDRVAALDLRTGRQTTQRLPASSGLRLLAAAPDENGFLLAYEVMGECVPTTNQNGEDSAQLNGFGGLPFRRQQAHVCFVHLHIP